MVLQTSEEFYNIKSKVKMKMCVSNCFSKSKKRLLYISLSVILLFITATGICQSGEAGINQANTQVRQYFGVGINLMYAVGAVVGLIGAIKVFQKWNSGDQDTSKVAAAWFGSCVFLVIVATVLRSFFGIA